MSPQATGSLTQQDQPGEVVTESSSAATLQWAESLISGEQLSGESETDDCDAGGH
jgi:hypothetical protein